MYKYVRKREKLLHKYVCILAQIRLICQNPIIDFHTIFIHCIFMMMMNNEHSWRTKREEKRNHEHAYMKIWQLHHSYSTFGSIIVLFQLWAFLILIHIVCFCFQLNNRSSRTARHQHDFLYIRDLTSLIVLNALKWNFCVFNTHI